MQHIAIFGCPRSGTSWLGQIFNASPQVAYRYQPLFSYEFKDWFGRHGISEATLAAFHEAIRGAQSDFVLQDQRPRKSLAQTHLLWKEVRYHQLMAPLLALQGLDHLIYLHREPVAMLNSWYCAPKEFRNGQDIRREFRHAPSKNQDASEFNGLEQWKASLAMAIELVRLHPLRCTLVDYDALCADPAGMAAALFARCALPGSRPGAALPPAVADFIARSSTQHDDDAYSVFRARRAAITLPADVVAEIRTDAEAVRLRAAACAASLRPSAVAFEPLHELAR